MKKSIKINAILSIIQKCCHILFPLIIFPYVSRTLGAQNYGKFSFAQSINSYFLLAAMLGVSTYAVREGARIRDDKNKIQQFASEISTINIVSLFFSYAIMIVLILSNEKLYEYKELLFILSIILPCTFFGRDWINTVYEDYLYITIRYIIVQVLGIICIFCLVKNEEDYIKYTFIYMLMASFGHVINFLHTRKYVKFALTKKPNFKRHLRPILTLFCGQIATSIYIQSDITMLGIFVNESAVGVYAIASNIYVLAKGIINAVTTVTIPRIVYYLGREKREQYNEFTNNIFKCLMLLVFPLAVGLSFFSENVLLIVGGEQYLEGGTTLKVLSLALLFAVFSGFYCNAIMVPNRRENTYFKTTIIAAVINISFNMVFIPVIGMLGAALTTMLSEIVVCILAIKETSAYVDIKVGARDIISVLLGSAAVFIVCYISKVMIENYILELLIVVLISAIVYIGVLILTKNRLVTQMYNQGVTKLKKKCKK